MAYPEMEHEPSAVSLGLLLLAALAGGLLLVAGAVAVVLEIVRVVKAY